MKASIGLFDSGVGGISVLTQIRKEFRTQDLVYVFDKSGLPYGSKTEAQLTRRVEDIVTLLAAEGAKLVVSACNTASCVALPKVKSRLPLVGVKPPLDQALARYERVLLLCTPLTASSELVTDTRERTGSRLIVSPQPNLAQFVEQRYGDYGFFSSYIANELSGYVGKVDAIVLGCTHYYSLTALFRAHFGVPVLDGRADALAAVKDLGASNLEGKGRVRFLYL